MYRDSPARFGGISCPMNTPQGLKQTGAASILFEAQIQFFSANKNQQSIFQYQLPPGMDEWGAAVYPPPPLAALGGQLHTKAASGLSGFTRTTGERAVSSMPGQEQKPSLQPVPPNTKKYQPKQRQALFLTNQIAAAPTTGFQRDESLWAHPLAQTFGYLPFKRE